MPRYFPNRETFHRIAADHPARPVRVPVYRQLLADKISPVAGFLAITKGDTAGNAFLFESVTGGENVGRHSFIGANPSSLYIAQGGKALCRGEMFDTIDPLGDLRKLLGDTAYARNDALPAFTGGLVGYAGYDLVRYYEPHHKLGGPTGGAVDDRRLPDVCFGLYDDLIVFDNVDKTAKIIGHAVIEGDDLDAAYDDACRRVDALFDAADRFKVDRTAEEIDTRATLSLNFEPNRTRENYEDAVRTGIEYIRAGDIFQFVPSLRLRARSNARPFDVYRALRVINPSPFMVYLRCGGTPSCTLIGNSPEILCSVDATSTGRRVTTRPLAGTRPRGASKAEDDAFAAELLADPKERSEHTMLVDLHRNDIGRVSETGSVKIDSLMVVERYSHVMHISSNVTGMLADEFDAFDALRVSLPVGTVSGAPKVRAMQIIDELEPTRRGPYGGAVGHIDFSGDMATCIALRTIVHHDDFYDVQAGAGVVADSIPAGEYDESMRKAAAMLKAVQIAEGGF